MSPIHGVFRERHALKPRTREDVEISILARMVDAMQERSFLHGLVTVWTLPQVQPGPAGAKILLKRLMLPQGELAQFHDSEEVMRYIAAIELKAGTLRGNHYHKIKREYVYVLSGRLSLTLEDLKMNAAETVQISAGDLILIEPGVFHALEVEQDGVAVEFSPDRFDAADTYRKL